MADVEAVLVAALDAIPEVAAAGVEVPLHVEELLPFVAVQLLPGSQSSPTWQGGTGWMRVDVDVDVLGDFETVMTTAAVVRRHLERVSHPGVACISAPPMSRRVEHNERIRKVGAIFVFQARP